MSIKSNLEQIQSRITKVCEASGRNPEDVMLLAVTKTRSVKEINEIISLGVENIGENRVQELIKKYDDISPKARWHLIGHLQTNKVKYIADKVCMIHSVESISLAKEISKQCKKHSRVMDILIEVNISGEESKSGIAPNEIFSFIDEICGYDNIKIRGLMTMAPKGADDNELHDIFSQLSQLAVDISEKKYDNISMDFLSMGMSGDFEIAISEGSNIVRIGTALFK